MRQPDSHRPNAATILLRDGRDGNFRNERFGRLQGRLRARDSGGGRRFKLGDLGQSLFDHPPRFRANYGRSSDSHNPPIGRIGKGYPEFRTAEKPEGNHA